LTRNLYNEKPVTKHLALAQLHAVVGHGEVS